MTDLDHMSFTFRVLCRQLNIREDNGIVRAMGAEMREINEPSDVQNMVASSFQNRAVASTQV